MINYFEWPKKKILVTSLRLDYENPRLTQFGSKPSQLEIMEYLIENEKILELAKSIIQKSYFLNEQPIVTKENNKFVVLEGNRRVTACKILINPDLIKNTLVRNQVKKLVKNFDLEIIKKLEVFISPDRASADQMIVNRHTGGSVVERWDKTKQDRFIFNRFNDGESIDELALKFTPLTKADIKKSLKRYNTFNEIKKLDLEDKYEKVLLEETKFSMTNVERVYDSKHGKFFLGIDFNEDNGKLIKLLPRDEFIKRLSYIVEQVIDGKINSRTLNTENQKQKYFDSLLKSNNFDATIPLSEENNYEEVEEVEELPDKTEENDDKPNRIKKSSSVKLFNSNIHLVTGIKRIDKIFEELKDLNLKKHTNAIAVLTRCYLDMLTYQFLKNHGGIVEIKKEKGQAIQEENNKLIEKVTSFYSSKINYDLDDSFKEELKKQLKLNGGVPKDFVPSLKFMLSHLVKSSILDEPKMKSSLQSHLSSSKKVEKIIGHNELNNLVHNEYYPTDSAELQEVWEKLYPLIEYMVLNIKKK
ncbi:MULTISPECIES: ParB/Srx family N-terminal domain-containing protein [Elizabethkingia]|uniref:ParB/Srx family N-terminal domain-containing protein n=1 Tax=Elizabethkingia TaxID=308865 RepID=UPI00099B14AF|nr:MULTISPECIES: ParB/Srx family N-terminal domain-containing protein [Elizabethkingia]AQX87852.1 hypothetical protein AYC67_01910 [Elizabethkingia anophelis]MDV3942262.1 hypothetical protein [Elizabethkingia anophelis]OPB55558.1 hypothetical protein BAY10_14380 [Elizabethkingia anophelis]OPC08697.1 hypothetical protein BAY01_14835 [Elizabethkingia miricola]